MLVSIGALVFDYTRVLLRRKKLPPGPFPWPLFGNHFQIPRERPWIGWEQWAVKHDAPMMTIWLGNEPRIIVSDAWVASDLMEKRADIWSSRPRIIAMGDAINATHTNQTTLPYGDRWRLHRRLMVGTRLVDLPTSKLTSSAHCCWHASCERLSCLPSGRVETPHPRYPRRSGGLCYVDRAILSIHHIYRWLG